MDDIVPPTTPGGYCTTKSSCDICITDKMNRHPANIPPTAVSFTTHTVKKDETPYISAVPTLKVVQAVTYIG